MTTRTSESSDDSGMEDFGYKESLDRSIGKFASFAAGVSYISILTGTFQLFYVGYGNGGPAYLWSWPMVFIGQMAVALCFMELAAKYPVAGSVYNWSKQTGGPLIAWSAGWLMLTASIVSLSAVVLALQLNLPRLWSGFQVIGAPGRIDRIDPDDELARPIAAAFDRGDHLVARLGLGVWGHRILEVEDERIGGQAPGFFEGPVIGARHIENTAARSDLHLES